jgi:YD repeat-containing protein
VRRDVPGDADTTYVYNGFGELERVANADATMTFAFDAAGRQVDQTTTGRADVTPPTTRIGYSYDAADRIIEMAAPWGSTAARTTQPGRWSPSPTRPAEPSAGAATRPGARHSWCGPTAS